MFVLTLCNDCEDVLRLKNKEWNKKLYLFEYISHGNAKNVVMQFNNSNIL